MSDKASSDGLESDQTFEINIKTLETQVHKVRVTKDMTVTALKEKIVDLTGLPVEQQRLIFRGRVLKDTDPLSEYHVEAGHTLHLVARRPTEATGTTSTETNNSTGTESGGNGERNRQRNVLLGAVNIAESGDDLPNLIMQGVGELLRTIGAGIPAPGVGPTNDTSSTNAGNGGSEQNGSRGQAVHQVQPGFAVLNHQLQFSQIPPLIPRNMMIPDSLTTLQEFIHRMERVLTNSGSQNNAQNTARPPAVRVNQRGVPTSDALVSVLEQARQLITGSFTSSISHLMERLQSEAGSTDASVRQSVQSEAMRAGISMQHMGALLLELGRTTMTLRVGPTPEESFVNAGPAAYIHSNGPNPIMVQPVALQTAPLIGGPVTSGNAGLFPGEDLFQNINIEIHPGSMTAPADPNTPQQTQPTGDPQPIRSLAPGVPARTAAGPTGHIVSVIYPVQVRTTQMTAGSVGPASAAPQAQPTSQTLAGMGDNGFGSLLGQISAQLNSVLSGRNLGQVNAVNNVNANANANANASSGAGTGIGIGTAVQAPQPVNLRARSLNRQGVIRSGGVQSNTPEDNNPEKKTEQGSSSDAVASSASDTMQSPKHSLGSEPPAAPLGLGLGGLRPTKKTKQSNSAASGSGSEPSQPSNPMEQMLQSLLSGSGSGTKPTREGPPSQAGSGDMSSMSSQPANPNPIGQILQSLLGGSGAGPNPARQGPPQSRDIGSMSSQPANPNPIGQILQSLLGGSGSGSGAGPNPARQGPPQSGDIGSMLSQVFQSPALDNLLTSMAGQTGMGSPNELRGMLEQCTRDPAVEGMFSDLVSQVDRQRTGESTGPSNGGVDLSGLVQKMMPIVANVISSGTGTGTGTTPRFQSDENPVPAQQAQSGTTTRIGEIPLQRAAVRIEGNDSAANIFTSVVESAGFYDDGDADVIDLVEELSSDHNLANEYMNVLYEEIRKRLQSESNSADRA